MRTFDEQRERAEQDGSEWIFGAVETDLGLIPANLRLFYAPKGVPQFNTIMDTNGCASRAPLNILETKFTYLFQTSMHPNLVKWLADNGYVEDGKVVFNDAFIEILSGTTKDGNSLKAPCETIRKQGLIPRSALPLEPGMTWEEYMDEKRITPAMYALADEFKRRFTINYEQVPLKDFQHALDVDLLSVAGNGWPSPTLGVYPRTDGPFNHAFACVDNVIYALDNYNPFTKKLAPDYKLFDWGYSLSITSQNPFPDETIALFEVLQRHGLLRFFAEAFNRLISSK